MSQNSRCAEIPCAQICKNPNLCALTETCGLLGISVCKSLLQKLIFVQRLLQRPGASL